MKLVTLLAAASILAALFSILLSPLFYSFSLHSSIVTHPFIVYYIFTSRQKKKKERNRDPRDLHYLSRSGLVQPTAYVAAYMCTNQKYYTSHSRDRWSGLLDAESSNSFIALVSLITVPYFATVMICILIQGHYPY